MTLGLAGLQFKKQIVAPEPGYMPPVFLKARVLQRIVCYRDRADGSQSIFDIMAVARTEDKTKLATIVVVFGVRPAHKAATHGGDYAIRGPLDYQGVSAAWVDVFTGPAGKTPGGAVLTKASTVSRRAKYAGVQVANRLRQADFWVPAFAKRTTKAQSGLKWFSLRDDWRIPFSKQAAFKKSQAIAEANKWVSETVEPVRGGL